MGLLNKENHIKSFRDGIGLESDLENFLIVNKEVLKELVETAGIPWYDEYTVQNQCIESDGRIDILILRDGVAKIVIELMLGKTDKEHIGKTPMYMSYTGADYGIILAEGIGAKDHVKFLTNEKNDFKIALVTAKVITVNGYNNLIFYPHVALEEMTDSQMLLAHAKQGAEEKNKVFYEHAYQFKNLGFADWRENGRDNCIDLGKYYGIKDGQKEINVTLSVVRRDSHFLIQLAKSNALDTSLTHRFREKFAEVTGINDLNYASRYVTVSVGELKKAFTIAKTVQDNIESFNDQ
jgi:hypothetical protein